jgi:hypothetical protein
VLDQKGVKFALSFSFALVSSKAPRGFFPLPKFGQKPKSLAPIPGKLQKIKNLGWGVY